MVFASPCFVSTRPHCDVLVLLSLTGADAYGTVSLFRHRCQCQPHAWISRRRQRKTLSRLLWQFIFTVVVSELCSISVQAWGTDALWYNGRILFVVQRHTGARWQAGCDSVRDATFTVDYFSGISLSTLTMRSQSTSYPPFFRLFQYLFTLGLWESRRFRKRRVGIALFLLVPSMWF